ncbi:septum site-determining protein Ssd [Dactylosporangium sp. McL0621]|uniref:septum site-determining protein Ssd n=1 Tax=Dactylosporangium sp. McL0621 TaxID=3415678 RepID=UPI003CF92BAB
MHRPLLVSDDPALLDRVVDLAARHALELDVAPGPADARRRYSTAPLVLIGDEAAHAWLRAGLPERAGVMLLTRGHGTARVASLAEEVGAEWIVRIPDGERYLLRELRRASAGPAVTTAVRGRILACIGGRGGAGATVLAAGLALTAGRAGLRTLLVDADPLGGGADLALGWEKVKGLRWPALEHTDGPVDPGALFAALPARDGVALLSCGRDPDAAVGLPPAAMASALDAGGRARDLVVADLPRRLDDAATLALRAADLVLLVVPAEMRACMAAARVAATIAPHTDAVQVVVRDPGEVRRRQIEAVLRLPVAGELHSEGGLPGRVDRGAGPPGRRGSLVALCRHILGGVGLGPVSPEAGAAA